TARAGSNKHDAIAQQAAAALDRAPLEDRLAAYALIDPAACARTLVGSPELDARDAQRALKIVAESLPKVSPELCRGVAERWGSSCAAGDLVRLLASTPIEEWTDSLAYVLEQAIDRVPRDTSLLRLRIALAAYRREPTVLHDCLNRIVAADPSWATATFAAKHWR